MSETPDLAGHVGRTRITHDVVTASVVQRMAATLGTEVPDGALPPLWHWLFANPPIPKTDLGEDGHERLGLFMPDFKGALRMWAGSDIRFMAPIRIGDAVAVQSQIISIVPKKRPNDCLWFVEVEHVWHTSNTEAILDRQTIVYRVGDHARPAREPVGVAAAPGPTLATAAFDDTALFRYSAPTFNSHRIHLDRAFCLAEMGDDRLIAHGPLLATLAAGAARDLLGTTLSRFSFRARQPVREGEQVHVIRVDGAQDRCALQMVGLDGTVRIEAQAWTNRI